MSLRLALSVSLLLLAGCGREDAAPAPAAPAEPPAAAAPTPAATPAPAPAPDPAAATATPGNAFAVQVSLTPAAAAKLDQDAETIIVAATWFGEPLDTEAAQDAADGAPWLTMATMERELDGPGEAAFPNFPLDPAQVALIATVPQLHINVYSGRRSAPDNLLSCDLYQDDLAKAAAGIDIHCGLIGEARENRDRVGTP